MILKVSHQAPIEKAGGCLHVHCTKSDIVFLERENLIDSISGAALTCAGTVCKSSQRDLESTAISAPPGGISGHNDILEHGKYMYRWHSNYPEFQFYSAGRFCDYEAIQK